MNKTDEKSVYQIEKIRFYIIEFEMLIFTICVLLFLFFALTGSTDPQEGYWSKSWLNFISPQLTGLIGLIIFFPLMCGSIYYFLFRFVKQIIIEPDFFEISTILGKNQYSWNKIKQIVLQHKKEKGRWQYVSHFLIIKTSFKKYRIRLNDMKNVYVKNYKEMIKKIEEKIKVETCKTEGYSWF